MFLNRKFIANSNATSHIQIRWQPFKKMKKHIIIALIFTGLFSSCSNNNRTVYLQADQIDGLTTEATVTLKGFEIGQVDEIQLNRQGKILIKLQLDKEPELPADSKFIIENRDLFGSKGISVQLGDEKKSIVNGDTIQVINEKSLTQGDSLPIKIQDIFENLIGAKQRDSILFELRRLNKNLEELKEGK